MFENTTRSWRMLGLGVGAATLLLLGGCGESEDIGDATVTVPEPVAGATEGGTKAAGTTEGGETAATGTEGAATEETAVKAEGWGTLKGRVVFNGNPPELTPLVKQGDTSVKDGQVCAAEPVPNQTLVVDPESKGVKWALVYIPRPTAVNPEAKSEAASAPLEFDQKGCMFEPHVIAGMVGNKVEVKSSDPVGHNVNSKLINTKFNFSIQPGTGVPPIDLRAPETRPGDVVCDIHPWMKSWWLVSNNPYFAVTDEKGNFEIKNVPAGTQKVVVWQEAVHPKFVTASSGDPITIKADEVTEHTFQIEPSQVNK